MISRLLREVAAWLSHVHRLLYYFLVSGFSQFRMSMCQKKTRNFYYAARLTYPRNWPMGTIGANLEDLRKITRVSIKTQTNFGNFTSVVASFLWLHPTLNVGGVAPRETVPGTAVSLD